MRQYIDLMHKCPANNDQFTRQMNWNIAMNALTSLIELNLENLRMTTSSSVYSYLIIKFESYLAINNNNTKNNTASYNRQLD